MRSWGTRLRDGETDMNKATEAEDVAFGREGRRVQLDWGMGCTWKEQKGMGLKERLMLGQGEP